MKKIAKIISRILIILLAALMLFTLVSFVIHRVKTAKEIELLKEKGYYNPISVGDYSITEREMTSVLENDNMVVFLDGTQLSDAVFDENSNGSVGYKDNFLSFFAKLGYGRYMLRENYWLLPDNYSEEEQKLADALQLRTEYSIALAYEGYLHDQNLQDAWSSIVTNDIPKLYICSSWGIQTKKDLTEYLEWFGRLKEKNHLEIASLTDISDEFEFFGPI